jgi:hypothetical protein
VSESDHSPDDSDGVEYRVVEPLPDSPRWVAARAGVDYVSGAACAREWAEIFAQAVETATGTPVVRMRPLVSAEGTGSVEFEFGTGTLRQLTEILTGGRGAPGGPIVGDGEAGGESGAPTSEG